MASNPPGECCGLGHLHEGTVQGRLETFAGHETYISSAPYGSTKKVLLFITDVIGHRFINAQLLADAYASNGYHVVMPDIFNGDAFPLGGGPKKINLVQDWLPHHQPEHTSPIINTVVAEIKSQLKPEHIFAVGYCFGAKYVVHLLGAGEITAGFTAHPSFVTLEEVAEIKRPLSIAAAETDSIFTTELRHQTEAKLAQIGATYQITLTSGVEHGFAVRADVTKPWQKYAKEFAFKQAVNWFELHSDRTKGVSAVL